MFNSQQLYEFVKEQWDTEILPSLIDYIKIPNKSPNFDPLWEEHGYMEKAVNHVANWCRQHAPSGMQLEILKSEGRTPLIFIEIKGHTEDRVLLYGHLDQQPEFEGWHADLGPWKPVLKDGLLYGRGSADDGYAVYAALTAISALQAQNLPHPHCFLVIEACEESGSHDLPFYMNELKERIGDPDLVVCLDSGAGNYDQLWMTTSLRGNIVGELSVELIYEGVHSGNGSGIIADSFRVARHLISSLEDEATGKIKLKELHCDIPEERLEQANLTADILGDDVYKLYPWLEGVEPVIGDKQQLILNRAWRPALTITGADGLPAITDAGNVLRTKTALKLSMRLPPLVEPKKAASAMQRALSQSTLYNAKVTFETDSLSKGWNAPAFSEWLTQACEEASLTYYKKSAAYMGEGGTIPFMAMLGQQFPKAQFMITGVLGPYSNAHGPNEFLHLDMVKKLTSCVSFVLHRCSSR